MKNDKLIRNEKYAARKLQRPYLLLTGYAHFRFIAKNPAHLQEGLKTQTGALAICFLPRI